jgi:hypothetical protein
MAVHFCDDCGDAHDGVICDEHCPICCFAHHRRNAERDIRIEALYNHFVLGYDWEEAQQMLL